MISFLDPLVNHTCIMAPKLLSPLLTRNHIYWYNIIIWSRTVTEMAVILTSHPHIWWHGGQVIQYGASFEPKCGLKIIHHNWNAGDQNLELGEDLRKPFYKIHSLQIESVDWFISYIWYMLLQYHEDPESWSSCCIEFHQCNQNLWR